MEALFLSLGVKWEQPKHEQVMNEFLKYGIPIQ